MIRSDPGSCSRTFADTTVDRQTWSIEAAIPALPGVLTVGVLQGKLIGVALSLLWLVWLVKRFQTLSLPFLVNVSLGSQNTGHDLMHRIRVRIRSHREDL